MSRRMNDMRRPTRRTTKRITRRMEQFEYLNPYVYDGHKPDEFFEIEDDSPYNGLVKALNQCIHDYWFPGLSLSLSLRIVHDECLVRVRKYIAPGVSIITGGWDFRITPVKEEEAIPEEESSDWDNVDLSGLSMPSEREG
jgi:hypothetical protein